MEAARFRTVVKESTGKAGMEVDGASPLVSWAASMASVRIEKVVMVGRYQGTGKPTVFIR